MSFYVEIENWDDMGPKTFLVLSFNAASKANFSNQAFHYSEVKPFPDKTYVKFVNQGGGYPAVDAVIPVGYEEFKQKLLEARKANTIPSFSKII